MPSTEARNVALTHQPPSLQVHYHQVQHHTLPHHPRNNNNNKDANRGINNNKEDCQMMMTIGDPQLSKFNIVLRDDEVDDSFDPVVLDVSSSETDSDDELLDNLFLTEQPIGGSLSVPELFRLMRGEEEQQQQQQETEPPMPSPHAFGAQTNLSPPAETPQNMVPCVSPIVSPLVSSTTTTDSTQPPPKSFVPEPQPQPLPQQQVLLTKKPKRSLSAFNIFFSDERKRMMGEPRYRKLSFSDTAKLVASRWRSVSREVKMEYEYLSEVDKERYQREIQAWNEQQHELQRQSIVQGQQQQQPAASKRRRRNTTTTQESSTVARPQVEEDGAFPLPVAVARAEAAVHNIKSVGFPVYSVPSMSNGIFALPSFPPANY